MVRACIFDLDGTLMNTIGTITHYLNAALGAHGFAPFGEDRVKYFVGNGARLLVERALSAHGALTEEDFAAVLAVSREITLADCQTGFFARLRDNFLRIFAPML